MSLLISTGNVMKTGRYRRPSEENSANSPDNETKIERKRNSLNHLSAYHALKDTLERRPVLELDSETCTKCLFDQSHMYYIDPLHRNDFSVNAKLYVNMRNAVKKEDIEFIIKFIDEKLGIQYFDQLTLAFVNKEKEKFNENLYYKNYAVIKIIISDLGVCDLELEGLKSFVHKVKPVSNQITLQSKCEMPTDLLNFAKSVVEILSDADFHHLLKMHGLEENDKESSPLCVLRYSIFEKTVSVTHLVSFAVFK
ncbi:hypothetical protein ROZALSC1DRAFT_26653 [Rozella allomycis CSF55]|uniref:Uncharacterized protein n=1 Tax=Rozella allomycis (strain CSF55) TaxID=988480 RepID=A0A075B2T7_ROZAC|nr:hypothetical protein O9G_005093 [Rozella allomycis CSF55]RKP21968.1 hypothetical protein ROZALSC1DRAFT_26653 [Rozella allomycis CSF55]|eukprot:EPZ36649.1 hypothetical protein O9G_005093 [Rozella allomycis CSF55]